MFCTRCGQAVADNDRFCGNCGQPRAAAREQAADRKETAGDAAQDTSKYLRLDEHPQKLSPLQLRRVRTEARRAHREGRYDEAAQLYAKVISTTPDDRDSVAGLAAARACTPLREVAGFQALGLTLLLPALMLVAPLMPDRFFDAWVIIPTIMVVAILSLYGYLTAFKGLFQQGGKLNRSAAGIAIVVVPAAIAGALWLDDMRTREANDRSREAAINGTASTAGEVVDGAARSRVDAARRRGDYRAALEAALPGAEAGDAHLQFVVADIYMNGWGEVEAEPGEAFAWMSKAAAGGEPDAAFNVGYMFEHGQGVERNPDLAFGFYYDLALTGHVLAQNSLGLAYANGIGTAVDHVEAVHWFRAAAEAGCAACMLNLGRAYELGNGVEIDIDQARSWYQRAVDLDYAPAAEWLQRLE